MYISVLILEIKLSRGEVDWDQEGRWTGIKRGGGLGSRGKVDWDAINPATLDIPMTYRSLQVYQRSYSQVGHRVLSDFTLKIVRQNQFNIVFYNKIYTIKNVSC